MEQEQDVEEYKALTSCLSSFYEYGNWARHTLLKPKNDKWNSLSARDRDLIPWFSKYLQDLDNRIKLNEAFLQKMALEIAMEWEVTLDISQWYRCNYNDLDKVRSTLKQLVREWSVEGEVERDICFKKILNECESIFGGDDDVDKSDIKVLVTGCGLGRLVLEFVDLGYSCQGNEFSYHMLLMSSYILNHVQKANDLEIAPFIHKISHQISRDNLMRVVKIPDFNPLDIFQPDVTTKITTKAKTPKGELMSMCAGSFTDLYGPLDLMNSETYTNDEKLKEFRNYNKLKFDIVVTCFFLDTASNIIDYLKTVLHCLKDTGVWINFGPLLWHFEEDDNMIDSQNGDVPLKGMELTREDLHDLCENIGFEFLKYENNIDTSYGGDIHNLGQFNYKCEYWVCRKKQSNGGGVEQTAKKN